MAIQEDLEKLKKAYEEAQHVWEKAKKAHVEAWRAYFKARFKKNLNVAQEAREVFNEATAVYRKAMDEYTKAVDELSVDKYYYMTPDALVMYVIPKELIKKYGCRKLTGGHAKSISAFEIGTRNNTKEPQVKHTAKATYRTDELMKFLKVATMLGAEHVTLSLATDEAVKITARNEEGREVSFWLAAYIKD